MRRILLHYIWLSLLIVGCASNDGAVIEETGTLEAREVDVSALVSGTVVSLRVDEGAYVKSGDTLAILDSTEWRLQLDQAEAQLRGAAAQYALAVEGPRKEDLAQAKANLESAERDLHRMETLWKTQTITEKMLEDTRTRYTLAYEGYKRLERGTRKQELELAETQKDRASAQVALLRKKLADCTVTSPLTGTVVARFVEEGELVGTGMRVFRIANLEELELIFYVSEMNLPRISLGSTASIKVDAFSDRTFEGTVVFISPIAEFTPKNIQTKEERTKLVFGVKVNVRNPDRILKAGIPADVSVRLEGVD